MSKIQCKSVLFIYEPVEVLGAIQKRGFMLAVGVKTVQ